jgi:hypothetical protein
MTTPEIWEEAYQAEIQHALAARESGNEGMARVCARRAAGILIGEYFRKLDKPRIPGSSYDRLRLLISTPQTPEAAREIANLLILRVDTDHTLPLEVDLIAEVVNLKAILEKT